MYAYCTVLRFLPWFIYIFFLFIHYLARFTFRAFAWTWTDSMSPSAVMSSIKISAPVQPTCLSHNTPTRVFHRWGDIFLDSLVAVLSDSWQTCPPCFCCLQFILFYYSADICHWEIHTCLVKWFFFFFYEEIQSSAMKVLLDLPDIYCNFTHALFS